MEQEQTDKQTPTGKIYKDRTIYVGTLIGGPLVAGYFIAENFKVFQEYDKVKKTWLYTIIATVTIFGGILLIPDDAKIPDQIIPLIYTAIVYALVKHFQEQNIQAHINSGGELFSWRRATAITLIGFVATVIVVCVMFVLIDMITSPVFSTKTH